MTTRALVMKFALEDRGYRVAEAENGHDAVEPIEMELRELILMDMSMPEVDALAATRRIKEIADEIRVIYVTAHGHYYEDKAIEAGCEEIAAKPVDLENLGTVIFRYLEEK
jgi:CheY-like chemotaxis protein